MTVGALVELVAAGWRSAPGDLEDEWEDDGMVVDG
jgi:hypothetical protein